MVANSIAFAEMTDETKRKLLVALVRDLSRPTRELLNIEDELGNISILSRPANAVALAAIEMYSASPEHMADLARRAGAFEKSYSVEEMLKLVAEDET